MPLQNATILTGPTISVSGGTSSTLSLTGAEVAHGIQVADTAVADYRVRPFGNFKQRQPRLSGKAFSKARNEGMLAFPKVCADGSIVFPLIRVIVEPHPEQTDAEVEKMLAWGAQLCCDTDFKSFFKTGALA